MSGKGIDLDKLRAAIRWLDDEYVYYMLDAAIELLPQTDLARVVRPYLDLEKLRPDCEAEADEDRELFNTPIADLDLSVRAYHCLHRNAGILTVGDLVHRTEQDLLRLKNLGRKTLKEIRLSLADRGLALGMRRRRQR